MRWSLVLLAILSVGCHRRRPAEAKPPELASAPNDDAVRSYDVGTRLLAEKNYAEARTAFEQSYRLGHKPAALFAVADCDRGLKHPGAAYEAYERILENHRAELGPNEVRKAEAAIAELRPLTASLDLSIGEPMADVEVDGKPWGKTPLPKQQHRFRAGASHVVRVSKAGFVAFEQTVTLAPNETKAIEVKLEPDKNNSTAQMSEADRKATARAAYLEGVALQEKGSCPEALGRFETAERLFDAPTHLLHIAECQIAVGKLVEAQETYETLVHARLDAQSPEAFTRARDTGSTELAALKPRVPTLRLQTVPAAASLADLVVQVNGTRVPADVVGLARPMNPGRYTIVATAGARHARASIELREGETRTIDLKLSR